MIVIVCTCGPTPPLLSLTPSPTLLPSTSLCRRSYPARARFAIPRQSEPLHDTQSANISREKEEEKGTYHPLQQTPRKTKGDGLPHKHDKTSCDVLQLRDVAAVEGETEVACGVPQPRMCTRENQQRQK
jgi:hypothetical protein